MPRRGLGRGLEELIPSEAVISEGLQHVAVDAIVPNPHQPRHDTSDPALDELAASIREHGILQPLVVTRMPDGGYQLIAGERRWRAARRAGLTEVPVLVKDAAPQQMLELALVENIQRADLNPLEEALAYQHLAADFGLAPPDIAQRVGKSRSAVINILRLLQATQEVQQAVLDSRITEGHARALLGLTDAEQQKTALATVMYRELNVRQTEALVRQWQSAPARTAKAAPRPEIHALEERFQQALGTRVQLKNSRKGGRVIIYYYSDEEFQALYHNLTGEDL